MARIDTASNAVGRASLVLHDRGRDLHASGSHEVGDAQAAAVARVETWGTRSQCWTRESRGSVIKKRSPGADRASMNQKPTPRIDSDLMLAELLAHQGPPVDIVSLVLGPGRDVSRIRAAMLTDLLATGRA